MNSILSNIRFEGDKIIWAIVFFLSIFSLLIVYSISGWTVMLSHVIKMIIGILFMYIVHKIKFKYFSKLGQLSYFLSLGLLILVFIIGTTLNGASRWLSIAGLQFQPSDVAKLGLILYLSRQLSIHRNLLNRFSNFFWYVILPLILICILVLPNNFSTSALLFLNGIILIYIAKVKFKYILAVVFSALILALSIYVLADRTNILTDIMPRSETWVSRINNYFKTGDNDINDKDYQQIQALVAIQNGDLAGLGPGKSVQKGVLPYSSSDFIYAIIIEEYGVIGGVSIILAYLILFFRAIRISFKTESFFASLVSVGLIFFLVSQALINMLVSVKILPVTGQTLPLISMGGTSIVFSCISIGIVLSISRDSSDRDYEKV